MKNVLFYYYQLYPEKLIQENKNYFFEINGISYCFLLLTRPEEEVKQLFLLNQELKEKLPFSKILLNQFGQFVTFYNHKPYALMESKVQKRLVQIQDITQNIAYPVSVERFPLLNRSYWTSLWAKKIDYFEYQKSHIEKKYPLLYESLDYYVGYAEVAISYIEEVNRSLKKGPSDVVTICHRRISSHDTLFSFYNPFSYVLDYKVRDIAEYLKSFFFDGYCEDDLRKVLVSLSYSRYALHLLMGRLLFPSFYFDLYEQIINGVIPENDIIKILDRSQDYEDFLQLIYDILSKKTNLLKIDFFENKRSFL